MAAAARRGGAAKVSPAVLVFTALLASAEEPLPTVPWQAGAARYVVQVPGSTGEPTLSLYPDDGPVRVATGETLDKILASPEDGVKWNFVELYDHMCPHCWYAVPIITDVAGAFMGSPNFGLHSVNCHMRANAKVCFFLEIISGARDYPTFLLCPPQHDRQIVSPEEAVHELSDRGKELLNHLGGEQRQEFMQLLRCKIRYEEKSAPRGTEDPFLSAQTVAAWVMEETGGQVQVMHPEVLKQGANFLAPAVPSAVAPPGRPGWLHDDKAGAPGVLAWLPSQRWLDSLRGFISLLHHGYKWENHEVTVHSTDFLSRAFPVVGQQLNELAKLLRRSGPLHDPQDFQKLLGDWARRSHLPAEDERDEMPYATCRGDSCAMWTLLHVTMTAVAARGVSGRRLLNDQSLADASHPIDVHEAMQFVRDFVGAFLTCGRCKLDFLTDFDNCQYRRCSIREYSGREQYRQLPLWLWRAHNAISLKVALQQEIDLDRRWPMYADCPTCWNADIALGAPQSTRRLTTRWTAQELDAPFVPERIFWHIVRVYIGVQNVAIGIADLSPAEQDEVQQHIRQQLEREKQLASGGSYSPPHPPPPPSHTPAPAPPGGLPLPPLPGPPGPPTVVQEPLRSEAHHRPGQAFGFLALAAGVAGAVMYYNCDGARLNQVLAKLDPRPPTRSPAIRAPQDEACQHGEEDDELVEGGGRFKEDAEDAEDGVLPEDPAAE